MTNPTGRNNPVFSTNDESPSTTTVTTTSPSTTTTTTTTAPTTTTTPSLSDLLAGITGSGEGSTGGGGGVDIEALQKLIDLAKKTVGSGETSASGGTTEAPSATAEAADKSEVKEQLLKLLDKLTGGNETAAGYASAVLAALGKSGKTSGAVGALTELSTAVSTLISSTSSTTTAGAAVSTSMSLAQLIYLAATSETARKSGQFCFKECGPSCMGNCCCPSCGCPDGECGCGKFGRCCCSWWGLICGVDRASQNLKGELERLEREYGKAVLLMALNSVGLDVVGILAGTTTITLPSIEDLENACRRSSMNFVDILKTTTMDTWSSAAANCNCILGDPFWRRCFVSAIADPTGEIDEKALSCQVRVLSSWGETATVCSCFDLNKISSTLPELRVKSHKDGTTGSLGIMQAAGAMQLLSRILMIATNGGTAPVWMSSERLMSLFALVLANYELSLAPQTGDPNRGCIYNRPEVRNAIGEGVSQRVQQHRGAGGKVTKKTGGEPVSQRFLTLAERCFGEAEARREMLGDLGNTEARDALIAGMSQKWLRSAGIQVPGVVTQQPGPAPRPTPTPAPTPRPEGRRVPPRLTRQDGIGGDDDEEEETIV